MKSFFSKLFGTVNDRKLRELKPRVERINLLEPKYQKMTDGELQNQTKFFKENTRVINTVTKRTNKAKFIMIDTKP